MLSDYNSTISRLQSVGTPGEIAGGAGVGLAVGAETAFANCLSEGKPVRECVLMTGSSLPASVLCGAAGGINPALGLICGEADAFRNCINQGNDPATCAKSLGQPTPVLCTAVGAFFPVVAAGCAGGMMMRNILDANQQQWEAIWNSQTAEQTADNTQRQAVNNAWEKCNFAAAVAAVEKFSPRPAWAEAVLPSLQRGLQAQNQVNALLAQANITNDAKLRRQLLAQAQTTAAGVPCVRKQIALAIAGRGAGTQGSENATNGTNAIKQCQGKGGICYTDNNACCSKSCSDCLENPHRCYCR